MGELLDVLRLNNFFMVAGTTERARGRLSEEIVGRGTPLTWDANNGTMVVYDDNGMPWIRSRKFPLDAAEETWAKRFNLQRGAYVPHSNDGGTFKNLISEKLGIAI